MVTSYKYLGQEMSVLSDLLAWLMEQHLQHFTAVAGCLRDKLLQLDPLGLEIHALLVSLLCTSHLLFGSAFWGPVFPVTLSLHPPMASSLASWMQLAFSRLLCWALDNPVSTCLEILHILANQPLVGTLVAKQLSRYTVGLEACLATAEACPVTVPPLCHAHLVWWPIR